MIKYEVGKPFPHKQYIGRGEVTLSILNESFFDVLISLNDITSEEKKLIRKGKLTVCLYEKENVAFGGD